MRAVQFGTRGCIAEAPELKSVDGAYRTPDGRFTVTRIEADHYRIDDARNTHLARYDRSIDNARQVINLILGVEAETVARLARDVVLADAARADIMRTLKLAGFESALNTIDHEVVVTAYAPGDFSYDLLRRTVAELQVEVLGTRAPSIYAVVPRS